MEHFSSIEKEMKRFIPVNEPLLGEREKELVMECLDTGWISSEGPFVNQFEEKLSKKINRKYGIACSNGSAALDIAVAALKIGPGDEVILPSFTIISCANSIVRAGAKPIVVDADTQNWNMRTDLIEDKISPKTVAIMMVHIYGLPVDVDPIIEIAKKHNLAVIEDAAEIIGGTYKDKPCGSFGTISTFSFYPNKHITTGEGGMVFTNDFYLAERCKKLRNLCFETEKRFVHKEIGWNYRMTNIQAALGLAQLESLEDNVRKKIKIGEIYNKYLSELPGIKLPLRKTSYASNIYWVYGILLEKKLGKAEKFMKSLSAMGVGNRPFFYPINKQPVFKKLGFFNDIQDRLFSEDLYDQGFYIPSGLSLNEEKINYVVSQLKKLLLGLL